MRRATPNFPPPAKGQSGNFLAFGADIMLSVNDQIEHFCRGAVSWAGGHNVRPPVGAVAVGARVAGRQKTAFADSCSFLLHLIRDQMFL